MIRAIFQRPSIMEIMKRQFHPWVELGQPSNMHGFVLCNVGSKHRHAGHWHIKSWVYGNASLFLWNGLEFKQRAKGQWYSIASLISVQPIISLKGKVTFTLCFLSVLSLPPLPLNHVRPIYMLCDSTTSVALTRAKSSCDGFAYV